MSGNNTIRVALLAKEPEIGRVFVYQRGGVLEEIGFCGSLLEALELLGSGGRRDIDE